MLSTTTVALAALTWLALLFLVVATIVRSATIQQLAELVPN